MKGKVALVTGASRGIGAAVARAYADAGAGVVLAARDADALDRVARELTGDVIVVPTDVADTDSVANLIEQTLMNFGRLDVACNNAAYADHMPTPLADITVERFDSAVAVNLRGVFLGMKHEIPAMLRTGGGAIVNMSSTAGHHGVSGLADYVATKWGLEGLTRTAALDYAAQGIRVNAIAPGPILTDGLAAVGPAAQEAAAKAMPMQRIGQPAEVAAAALWLSSEESAFITGTTVIVDGGELAGVGNFAMRKTQAPGAA
ncbi:MAG: SDR family oxidoreductase [Acidimicrobiia bacterium]|nr:SDR family oxidoreductase [Acidimicrobiia bacterium]